MFVLVCLGVCSALFGVFFSAMHYYDPTGGLGGAGFEESNSVSEHFIGITAFDAATSFRIEARFSSALRARGVLFNNLQSEITSDGRLVARNLAAQVDQSLTEVLGAIGRFSATVEEAEARYRMHISQRAPVTSAPTSADSVAAPQPEPRSWADQADEEEDSGVVEQEELGEPPADSGMTIDLDDLGEQRPLSAVQQ